MLRVELLNIGTELLMGFVVNTHASYLGRRMMGIGAHLTRQVCIRDSADEIVSALKDSLLRADVVITTGGLGPTSDDITREEVAKMFGMKLLQNADVLKHLQERFRKRGISLPRSTEVQALIPEGATVIWNDHGTAPGLAIPVPPHVKGLNSSDIRCKMILMFPGPPRELKPMYENHAETILLKMFQSQLPVMECRIFKIAGMGESTIAERVEPVLQGIDGLEIGYCARVGEVDLRLTVHGPDRNQVMATSECAEKRVRDELKDEIFGMGDATLEEVVVQLLNQRGKTVTVAESCTGGYVAHRVTMVSGSSNVFRRGYITYHNQAKVEMLSVSPEMIEKHGAVSGEVAEEMARGARQAASADYALAITGIAGPTGGSEDKPVGTVWIALASPNGCEATRHRFQYDRETFKYVTAQTALNCLRKVLLAG